MGGLFSAYQMREVVLRNRVGVAPMRQYSSEEGFATDWHLVHLGAFATGGAGLVMTEVTAVLPEGRISPHDLGIWDDAHVEFLHRMSRGSSSPTRAAKPVGRQWEGAAGGGYAFGWGPQDDEDSLRAMRHAIERGVNWIDTAAVYGLGH